MSDFYIYVHNIAMKRYKDWHPYNEVIEMVYRLLAVALRDGSKIFKITRTQILEGNDNAMSETLDITDHEQNCEKAKANGRKECTSFREGMLLIYEHDARVRHHLQVVEETVDVVSYRIS